MSKRDERLAAKLRAKQGDSYRSASEKAASRSTSATPGADATQVYDAVRSTDASAGRRSSHRSTGMSRWRRETPDEWNR